jgi:hypothetical protein
MCRQADAADAANGFKRVDGVSRRMPAQQQDCCAVLQQVCAGDHDNSRQRRCVFYSSTNHLSTNNSYIFICLLTPSFVS